MKSLLIEFLHKLMGEETSATKAAHAMGLKSMRYGRWGKNGVVTHTTDDNGKLVPVAKSKKPAAKPSVGKKAVAPAKVSPQAAPQFDKIANMPSYQRGIKSLKPAEKKQAMVFFTDLKAFYNPNTPPAKRKQLALNLIDKFQLSTSANRKKVYLGIFGDNQQARKMLGEGGFAERLLHDLEKATGKTLGGAKGGSNASEVLAAAAKPDLTDKSSATTDSTVADIFATEPLSFLESKFHTLHGPLGPNGKLVGTSGGKNSKLYFQHSVSRNTSLDHTIKALKELEPAISPKVRTSLQHHKKTMQEVAQNYTIPSPEAEKAVGESYAKLFQSIAEHCDNKIAGSLLKQFAEMSLYDTETAAGVECYLPAAGNFPSGDKIKITRQGTKIEKVASVSVKYGLVGGEFGSFGFPGETAQYQKYHPNPDYRNRNNSHPAEQGYSLGVRDDLIDEKTSFDKMFKQSGFAAAISNSDDLYKIMTDCKRKIELLRAKIKPKSFIDMLAHLGPIRKLNESYAKALLKCIDVAKLEELVGFDNAGMILSGPMQAATAMSFAATLNTSAGLTSIEHNHQTIGKDGSYHSATDTGSPDLKLWRLSFRGFDRRGGGLIASYNSNRRNIRRKEKGKKKQTP